METIPLIGRDKLLAREIYPRLKKSKPFILVGQRGAGKTEILKWAYSHYPGEKDFISAAMAYGDILRHIAAAQGIDTSKMKNTDVEKAIMQGKKIALFLDNAERATPKLIYLLTVLNDIMPIYMAGNEPFREELKRLIWGKNKIYIGAVEKKERVRLAESCLSRTGGLVPVHVIATQSRGIPGRAMAIARGEAVRDEAERVEGEEINIAPVMLLAVAGVVVVKYVGMGLGEMDLYLLGGIGVGLGVVARYYLFRMEREK